MPTIKKLDVSQSSSNPSFTVLETKSCRRIPPIALRSAGAVCFGFWLWLPAAQCGVTVPRL